MDAGLRKMLERQKVVFFHIHAVGSRHDGSGSGFAWKQIGIERECVEWKEGLTQFKALRLALIAAIQSAGFDRKVVVSSDSAELVREYYTSFDERALVSQAIFIVSSAALDFELRLIKRDENLARTLLERERK